MLLDGKMKSEFDIFFGAYIFTSLWSTNDNTTPCGGYPLEDNYDIEDIDSETLAKMKDDSKKFLEANAEDIGDRYLAAGHDFWLTRNGHGCGFWETLDWPEEAGKRLTEASKAFGEFNLYVGDDGKIYHL